MDRAIQSCVLDQILPTIWTENINHHPQLNVLRAMLTCVRPKSITVRLELLRFYAMKGMRRAVVPRLRGLLMGIIVLLVANCLEVAMVRSDVLVTVDSSIVLSHNQRNLS